METLVIGGLGVLLMVALILLRVHIGIAMLTTGFTGFLFLRGIGPMLGLMETSVFSITAAYTLSPVPLFLLMGTFYAIAGSSNELFDIARKWLGRLPGGLGIATNIAAAIFSAVSGSSTACAAVFTKLCLPDLIKHGYNKSLASACIAAAGTLDALIPPSGLIVIYCLMVDAPVGPTLIAGFVPGFMTAFLYSLAVIIQVKLNPEMAPRLTETFTWREKSKTLWHLWHAILLAGIALGGLYAGIFTPTEGAAAGAFVAFLLGLARRQMGWANILRVLKETASSTAMIFLVIVGAIVFSRFVAAAGLPILLGDFLIGAGLSKLAIMGFIGGVYLILGCLMDAIGMLAVTLPIFYPIIIKLGFDPVWFGIIIVEIVEIGLLTPPVGINAYVVAGASDGLVQLSDVFKGIIPFIICNFIMIVILYIFPEIILFLPRHMGYTP